MKKLSLTPVVFLFSRHALFIPTPEEKFIEFKWKTTRLSMGFSALRSHRLHMDHFRRKDYGIAIPVLPATITIHARIDELPL